MSYNKGEDITGELRINAASWNSKEESKMKAIAETARSDVDSNIDVLRKASQVGKYESIVTNYKGYNTCEMLMESLKYLQGYRGLKFSLQFTNTAYINTRYNGCNLIAYWSTEYDE